MEGDILYQLCNNCGRELDDIEITLSNIDSEIGRVCRSCYNLLLLGKYRNTIDDIKRKLDDILTKYEKDRKEGGNEDE